MTLPNFSLICSRPWYVVAGVPNYLPWFGKMAFEDMDAEETVRVVKNRMFREKGVKSHICDYLYHDGVARSFRVRKTSVCISSPPSINASSIFQLGSFFLEFLGRFGHGHCRET